ncbi:nucleoside-binding protein [Alteromonas sp. ASW11-130]|uniref:nucleoside-binding protein n=1 Tax=Alteromonas sp. ASW11-130 TaxID=3015775 RepID=UPI002241E4BE|nr:nucleoside-binding protein [Alteromonas sp. ASW11-130]MCW8093247.1 nucleoside-binding protein [Alteromonas sp. ASW11-130]
MKIKLFLVSAIISLVSISHSHAAIWSTTEIHYQHGTLDVPIFSQTIAASASTDTYTLQHASGWEYGDNFFFMDYINDDVEDGFNDQDFYAELYLNFSLSKITGNKVAFGPVKDVGIMMAGNFAGDAKVKKYLPGIRLALAPPGFTFFNIDIMAYIDDSDGVARGGAPTEDNSFLVDFNWDYPFTIGNQFFNFTGHLEYAGSRDNEFGGKVSHWILAQPQLRWDVGQALFNKKNVLFTGIEYQHWQNKLGDDSTDEKAVQFLLVWRF